MIRCVSLWSAWLCAASVWLCAASPARAQLLSPGALAKAHAELEGDGKCQRCHAAGARVAEPRCLDCHTDIGAQQRQHSGLHGGAFRGQECASCHVEHLGKQAALIRWPGTDPKRFDHALTGWPLRGAHEDTRCQQCHDQHNMRGAPTYLGLERRCGSCHEDPHQKRFGERCQDCHDESSFKRLALGKFDHDLARFPLRGAHTEVACVKCHHSPPQYRELAFADCSSCHQDPHEGRLQGACKSCHEVDAWTHIVMPRALHPGLSLAAGHQSTQCTACHDAGLKAAPSAGATCVGCHEPVHEAPFGERCEQCHAGVRWTGLPESLGRRVHRSTSFPLRGAHDRVDCADCHLPELPRDARYRKLEHDTCSDCHRDVHRGTLREHGDCALCHDPLGFAPSLVSPSLHASFGFALEGGHGAAACSACHKPGPSQAHAPATRLDWSKPNATCEDCHENPHGTQFATEMSSGGCGHCHSTKGWSVANFEHKAWPLTGAHANAPCSGCHQPTEEDRRTGHGASYRGVPRDCEGCHDDVHAGQFRSAAPVRACTFCHQTERFTLSAFDHAVLASYLLEGKHGATPCASCHPSVPLRSGEQVVRWRLGYDQCADCHADPHTVPEVSR